MLNWLAITTASISLLSLLSACGGGSSSSDSGSTSATVSVTSVTTDQLVYRKTTNLTVKGVNLDKGINISNPACLTITEVAGGTATQRVFSCKIVSVGTVALSITAGNGSSLYSGTLTVPLAAQPQVTMVTSMGTIVIELNPAKAPITVDNFLQYVESGFYVNKIFHRVISNFVIQGGGYTSSFQLPATLAAIPLESNNGLSNLRGSIAMARTSVANSATSQFYFNVVDNTSLDYGNAANPGYAVFGKIVSGLNVMDLIKAVPTGATNGLTDVPVTPIVINSALQTQ
ncbi:peptidylprolyl isomerase [Undibacterium sp. RTI2.1]|uniref:peptidylprolyl isomerase n=1 Tax=unclassified Undibacterium TaxID=2630295 RepID=UPI002AB35097|nr:MULTISPECIES: peptidylprolyl isomerase [unclassified Undibacterium]MDY7537099.1 peptidylprolyl isomerase [Undibacterium sp. 5I1]MEB0029862.1 peptidylprolyl isomerase [Undibacterium sp. RTI2.1]MEB0115147.1 peptidylprolyl isomerase [Undibacterium sp. RTI2.2]MEB0229277.1 peptidylprolyl isomerase [Undibacterium sp. 10I3]MEB0256175.1 peptidylprolyl isomerase [Undibacterium sp. 5I1]